MSGTLRDKLEAIAAARFDGYEIFENDLLYYDASPADVASLAADLGLACELYQPFRDFEGTSKALFERNLQRAERKFDVMQALGCRLMLVCSNARADVIADEALMAEQLYTLAERAAQRNIRVGYEALAWGRAVNRYGQAWSIVQRANHPHLGLILDSFHTLSLRDDPAGIASIPGEKIFFLQMADAPLLEMSVLQWARHHRSFPGQGDFGVVDFFVQTLRAGYTGPLSLEIFNDVFRETPNRRTAVDAMRSLLSLEDQARQRLAANARPAVELFTAPPVPALSGVSFIEIAADERSAATLDTGLRQLGFRRVGRHRSKAVVLYRQGDIHMIVNAQPGSFARERFDLHGTSVCALGLLTDDAQAAAERAAAMCSLRHHSPLGPEEIEVPAIVVPGGNLVHFVPAALGTDGLFRADFHLEETQGDGDAGLRAVDHLTLGLAVDQFDTWVLFSRAVLGLEPGETLEVADPYGLVRSRGVADSARRVRLMLNMSVSQRTRVARTLSHTGGGAVHHIALRSDDIFASVERLRGAGTRFLAISDNYYDDLPTRFDLDAPTVARLRAAGVLFDRSAAGDYLHIYTEGVEEGFFFEVVQRVGGYDDYGAGNAPARMAAQAQDAAAHSLPTTAPA